MGIFDDLPVNRYGFPGADSGPLFSPQHDTFRDPAPPPTPGPMAGDISRVADPELIARVKAGVHFANQASNANEYRYRMNTLATHLSHQYGVDAQNIGDLIHAATGVDTSRWTNQTPRSIAVTGVNRQPSPSFLGSIAEDMFRRSLSPSPAWAGDAGASIGTPAWAGDAGASIEPPPPLSLGSIAEDMFRRSLPSARAWAGDSGAGIGTPPSKVLPQGYVRIPSHVENSRFRAPGSYAGPSDDALSEMARSAY